MSDPPKTNILVVDDTESFIDIIVEALSGDYSVSVAQDGQSAIEAAVSDQPDLILLDIMMPGMDGYEVCEKLKAKETTRDIPVIFLTAKNEVVDVTRGFELGAVDYISKPISSPIVRARVKAHLALSGQNKVLKEANARLRELDRLKAIFIASMSHELRTPLTSIMGFTGIILRGLSGPTNDEQRDQLQRIYGAAKHLLSLITDIIDISKVESGKVDAYVEEFPVRELVKEVVAGMKTQIEDKGLGIEINVPPELLLITDKRRLRQCILNFLSNAVKYSENGSIWIDIHEMEGTVEIKVRDTGIGIREEDKSKLFNSFVRLDSPLKTKTPGTGLGLYLSKKLATDVLKGSVSVESRHGEGSTFALRIPRVLSGRNREDCHKNPDC